MNLTKFKSQVERQGLARSSRWVCRIYPPSGLADSQNIFNFDTKAGLNIALNLPGIDLLDNAVEKFNNLSLDLPGVSIGHNLNVPTLGYTLSNTGNTLDSINLFCNAAVVPGRDLQNFEWQEHGETRKLGYNHTHKGVTVSYYCSEDMRERLFFEKWQDSIFNPINKRRSYYKDYIGTIEIEKYSAGWEKRTALYRLKEAYPTNIAAQNLIYDETSVMRLDITFNYRLYERLE